MAYYKPREKTVNTEDFITKDGEVFSAAWSKYTRMIIKHVEVLKTKKKPMRCIGSGAVIYSDLFNQNV